ncbi:MAG: preprotein translocase subunit SecG [Deferribacteres bacterium]|nr:preprotein translocase subunit SecG [candidate division KSB1 bacterium]MCB9510666.1 preprotein translocase subunit SecG [Deferribacteres bacterium]
MYNLLLILFLIVCIIMVIAILLQSSKGGGLAGAFGGGGGGMGSVFGGRGAATFLSKVTTWLAVFYLLIALGLSKMQSGRTSTDNQSIISQNREQIQQPQSLLPPVESSIPAVGIDSTQAATAPDTVK